MKKLSLVLVTLLFMVALGGIAYGAATFSYPANGATLTGNTPFNITDTTVINTSLCNIKVTSATTGHTTNFTLYNVNGTTTNYYGNLNITNGTLATTQLPDATDYVISGTCYNGTPISQNASLSASVTAITVTTNNQQPTCKFSLTSFGMTSLASDTTYSTKQNWTFSGTNASTAKIKFGDNSYLTAVRAAANRSRETTFSYDPTSNPWDEGIWTITAEVKDPNGDTKTCSLTNVLLDDKQNEIETLATVGVLGGGGTTATTTTGGQPQALFGGGTGTSSNAAIWILVGVVAFMIFGGKKGKK